jgi:hypothetical protein
MSGLIREIEGAANHQGAGSLLGSFALCAVVGRVSSFVPFLCDAK